MKKFMTVIMAALMVTGSLFLGGPVKAEEKPMRAAWVSTVFNIDWPSKASYNNVSKQKHEYIYLLDKLKGVGINTVMVQVRPEADAFYKSSINPWSRYITGTQGKNPGYDPLSFMIEEAHKRGMEIHAWFNPYRASIFDDLGSLAPNSPVRLHKDWVIHYNKKWYFDPGRPEVRNYVIDSVMEVVRNYNIDGVHFDDYFYPGRAFPDDASYNKYSRGLNRDTWRRDNVNKLVMELHAKIKAVRPSVQFGISPGGIWRNKHNDPKGSPTNGNETYSNAYADTVKWIKEGMVDYVVPQVYWRIGHPKADYAKLVHWWASQVRGTNVKLYIGEGIYKRGQKEYAGENVAREIYDQVMINRRYKDVSGEVYFSARDILQLSQVQNDLRRLYPTFISRLSSGNDGATTKPQPKPEPKPQPQNPDTKPPQGLSVKQDAFFGEDRTSTSVLISKRGWPEGAETVVITEGDKAYDGIVSNPFAASLDAPILVTFKHRANNDLLNEIRRLQPKKIIYVGDIASNLASVRAQIDKASNNAPIELLGSSNIEDTSVEVAHRLAELGSIERVYVASSSDPVDVLSIVSKASELKQPIIITGKNYISVNALSFIKSHRPSASTYVGGPTRLSDGVCAKISAIVGNDYRRNRIYGEDRYETNALVIKYFYKDNHYGDIYATKGRPIIDAVTAAALSNKTASPIVILGSHLRPIQTGELKRILADRVIKIGGGINSKSYNELLRLVNN